MKILKFLMSGESRAGGLQICDIILSRIYLVRFTSNIIDL